MTRRQVFGLTGSGAVYRNALAAFLLVYRNALAAFLQVYQNALRRSLCRAY
jgi:hypothetical protein